jgi:hypothetical protein
MAADVVFTTESPWYTNSHTWNSITEYALNHQPDSAQADYQEYLDVLGVDFTFMPDDKAAEVAEWLSGVIESMLAEGDEGRSQADHAHMRELISKLHSEMQARVHPRLRMTEPVEVPGSIVGRVRALCLALPEVTVRVDEPLTMTRSTAYSFEIRRRSFCLLVARADSAGQPVPLLVLRAGPDERGALLAAGPPFFAPRAGAGRIGILVGDDTDWDEIRELVNESYRILAPKKLRSN